MNTTTNVERAIAVKPKNLRPISRIMISFLYKDVPLKETKENKYDDYDEKKKVQKDANRSEDIPSSPYGSGDSNETTNEGIVNAIDFGDRRHKVEPYNDSREIIKCIGRLSVGFDGDRDDRRYSGTGTVYEVKDGDAFVITCAHNVKHGDDDNNIIKTATSIEFIREKGENNTEIYNAEIVKVHNYLVLDDEIIPYKTKDLALLKFKDHDGFFEELFKRNENVVDLGCCDDINPKDITEYSIYGYPKRKDQTKYELWGMTAKSSELVEDKSGIEHKVYVQLNKKNTLFEYDAIDTEGGQSGSAIWIQKGNTYQIVGIHIQLGNSGNNLGVALNKKKIKWIND